jgi:iron complex outermembrane recepter protein
MRKFLNKIILLLTISIASAFAFGQQVFITVNDNNKRPLTGATVQLTKISDSYTYYSSSNLNGIAEFENISTGLYQVKISFIGFETLEKTINIKPDELRFSFKLNESAISLDEVTIEAKKPFISQEDDKMIIDPEPIANISTNTLEVLESTPGLYVDQDGGIFLTGATPAVVYINGREQKMSSQDITSLLQSLPPNSVQKIEVIRTPSTKYDAATSGGIINVVLKKGVKLGRFGSANLGFNQGKLGNRNAGFSLNSSGDNSTYYLNINYSRRGRYQDQNIYRLLEQDNNLFQNSSDYSDNDQLYLGYGINYDASEKISFSYDGRINGSFRRYDSEGDNHILDNINDTVFSGTNNSDRNTTSIGVWQDLGMVIKFDTLGSELDTKLSYSYSFNQSIQNYENTYLFPFLIENNGKNDNSQNRNFVLLQSDFIYKFPHKITFETGAKGSLQHFTSTGEYYSLQDDIYINNFDRNSTYKYLENINSAYAQISKTFGKHLVLKTGVRMEHTLMEGTQTIPTDTSFLINRADWFPYVYLSRRVLEIMGVEIKGYLIYRKTINRPDYQNLNPYVNYIDDFMYETGNPALKPQFTDNIEANLSFNDFPIFAVGQNYTRDIFSYVIYQDNQNPEIAIRTYDNIGKSKETYFRGMIGIPPGGVYFFAIGTQYNLNEYKGIYENEPLNYTNGSWRFFTFHSLKLFKETKITLSGFMMHNGMFNFLELSTFGQINIGVSQSLFNDKLTISFNVRDVLQTRKYEFQLNQGSLYSTGTRITDSRRFGVKIRYNFGIPAKKEKKDMFNFNIEE